MSEIERNNCLYSKNMIITFSSTLKLGFNCIDQGDLKNAKKYLEEAECVFLKLDGYENWKIELNQALKIVSSGNVVAGEAKIWTKEIEYCM